MGLIPILILSAIGFFILYIYRLNKEDEWDVHKKIIKETSSISLEIKNKYLLNKFKHLLKKEDEEEKVGSILNIATTTHLVDGEVIHIVEKEEIKELDFLIGNTTKWIELYKVSDKELDKIIKKKKK